MQIRRRDPTYFPPIALWAWPARAGAGFSPWGRGLWGIGLQGRVRWACPFCGRVPVVGVSGGVSPRRRCRGSMAWSRYQLGLAALMLLTGSINTLAAKYRSLSHLPSPAVLPSPTFPARPRVPQAAGMFLGELSCLPVFYLLLLRDRRRADPAPAPSRPFNPLLFLPPALCDMAGTSIMYVALNMTSASSFQMLRGSLIIFTGLLSVAFLGRRLEWSHWSGILLTILGLVLVGLADLRGNGGTEHGLADVITGIPGMPGTTPW
ncbi:solute carrier family 35 member F6-like, partial [Pyrgilauda ruficollis]|uniref:solute carrier family 35 member F6-like n=1 Tax=Pyrgilauda ruficollis TaxID=221976 RepID=UPI001B86B9BB